MIFGLFESPEKRNQRLRAAAAAGDLAEVARLLEKGADPNQLDPESGNPALVIAAFKNHEAVVAALLKSGANPNLQARSGYSALFTAATNGDAAAAIVGRLLEAGARPDLGPTTGEHAGMTPLYVAATRCAKRLMQMLVKAGASAAVRTAEGLTLMHALDEKGDRESVELVHGWGVSVDTKSKAGLTPLHQASATGNAAVAAALLDLGAAIDAVEPNGHTPLLAAAQGGKADVVKLLLERGANPQVSRLADGKQITPLIGAALKGHTAVVKLLTDAGVLVDEQPTGRNSLIEMTKAAGHEGAAKALTAARKRQRAALKAATGAAREADALWRNVVEAINRHDTAGLARHARSPRISALPVDAQLLVRCAVGDADGIRALLAKGANPSIRFDDVLDGMHALYAAVGLAGSVEATKALLGAGASPDFGRKDGATSLLIAVTDERPDLVKALIEGGAGVNFSMPDGLTPLMQAALKGSIACIDLLLDAGADINAIHSKQGVGAFGMALNRLDMDTARHLFQRGAAPNFGTIDTLSLALAEHADLAFIKAVAARGAELVREDQRGRVAFVAARNKDGEVFDYYLNHGADPSHDNDFQYTPLILASLTNHPEIVQRYLERGDDPSMRDVDGETALSLAIEKNHPDVIATLRKFGAESRNYPDVTDEEAMLRAASDGALGTILDLRDRGVPLNVQSADGNTPLMLAVEAGHLGVVRSLYHLGADINHRNRDGKSPLDIARARGHVDVVNTLQEFGALDSADGELGKLSALFSGVHVFNAADTLFGRMSHPYKQTPPYEEEESAADESAAEEEGEDAEETAAGTPIRAKLDKLEEVLGNEDVRQHIPDELLEQISEKLDHWRALLASSGLDEGERAELDYLLGLFGLADPEADAKERSPLLQAIDKQDLNAVKRLVKAGADVNEGDEDGDTPLIAAVVTGQEKLVDLLLKLGADPDITRPDGIGALVAAALTGNDRICQVLLRKGARVDFPAKFDHNGTPVEGCTALYCAAFAGNLAVCKALLGGGAQIDAANDLGYTPLMAAIQGGHDDVVDHLLKSGAAPDPDVSPRIQVESLGGATPLYLAVRKDNAAVAKKLLKRGADVNRPAANTWTPLKSAAQQGNLELVKVLLDGGADPNKADDTNYTPLMNAVSGQHEEIVRLLLKSGADANVQCGDNPGNEDWEAGRTALMDAAFSGNLSIAGELLKYRAEANLMNADGRTALHSAVLCQSPEMVDLLLKSGADFNVYGNGKEGQSALDLALRQWAAKDADGRVGGAADVLEMLLKRGVPKDQSSLNATALDLVAEGRTEVVEFLREHGVAVDPNRLIGGASALFAVAAVGDERLEAAKLLLKMGADPNFTSSAGLSVLALAVRGGATKLSEALLFAGADVMARTGVGVLAYDLAAIYDHQDLARRLIAHMNRKVSEIDRQDSEGNTALMRAVKAGDTDTVRRLLASGADASRRDLRGDSPLSYAVCHDLAGVVALLRAAGAERMEVNAASGGVPIVAAARCGALGTILDLLETGVPVDAADSEGQTALTAAEAHPGVIRVVARTGASLSHRTHRGRTAYMIAAASQRKLVMQALEEAGAPVDESVEPDGIAQIRALLKAPGASKSTVEASGGEDTPNGDRFLLAAAMGDAVSISQQIAAGADVNYQNAEGRTALPVALAGLARGEMGRRRARDFEQVIDSLLASGADPNKGDIPSLIIAAATRRPHVVNALIRAGADVNSAHDLPIDEQGSSQRHNALLVALAPAEAGSQADERVALALVRAGTDLSFASEDGSMAVHYAAHSGMVETLREIIDRRPVVIDAQDNDGVTPLMMAAANDRGEAIKVLLRAGADRGLRDRQGRTAADHALAGSHPEAAAALA